MSILILNDRTALKITFFFLTSLLEKYYYIVIYLQVTAGCFHILVLMLILYELYVMLYHLTISSSQAV